ncbi:MAG: cupin domain-containing protein [Myxococcaceae bacterium]
MRVWSLLDQVPAPFDCVLGCELDPNGHVGAHVQEDCAEVVIVTDGEGEAHVSGTSVTLTPGAVVPLPLGASLELSNASRSQPLRYLIVKALLG